MDPPPEGGRCCGAAAPPAPFCGPRGRVRVLARTCDGMCVMTHYRAATFSSLYISHMPEYDSLRHGKLDAQLLYNAVVFLHSETCALSLSEACIASLLASPAALRPPAVLRCPGDVQLRVRHAARRSPSLPDRRLKDLFPHSLDQHDEDGALLSSLGIPKSLLYNQDIMTED